MGYTEQMSRRRRQPLPLERAVRAAAGELGIRAADGIVVAVSGGADSMALLHALADLRREGRERSRDAPLVVAHLNHGLRDTDADADAELVRATADRMGLPAEITIIDVAAEAAKRKRNLEAVARALRYDFLAAVARARGIAMVATAHTADDQAETVLMRLARGAGLDGLSGVAPRRPLAEGVTLVRPLLSVTRAEVLAFCRARDVEFRTDTTNFDLDQTRAFVRHEVLPRLERFAPGAASSLARTARLAREDAGYFEAEVGRLFAAWRCEPSAESLALPAAALVALPAALARRALREAIRRVKGDLTRIDAAHVEAVEALVTPEAAGGWVDLPDGIRARRSGDTLVVERVGRNSIEKGHTRS